VSTYCQRVLSKQYLLSKQEFDDWLAKFMMGTFLVLDVQRRDVTVVSLGDFLAALLDGDFVDSLDEIVLAAFEEKSVFIAFINEVCQLFVITVDPYSLDTGTEFLLQRGFRDHIIWDGCNKDRPGGDISGNFRTPEVFLASLLEENELASKIPQNKTYLLVLFSTNLPMNIHPMKTGARYLFLFPVILEKLSRSKPV
jgi:hypothetical protein